MNSESDDSDHFYDANDNLPLDLMHMKDSCNVDTKSEETKENFELCLDDTAMGEERPTRGAVTMKEDNQNEEDLRADTSTEAPITTVSINNGSVDQRTVTANADSSMVLRQTGETHTAPLTEEAVERICNKIRNTDNTVQLTLQQNFINNPTAVTVGGQVSFHPPTEDSTPPQSEPSRKKERGNAERDIEDMIRGMVDTKASKSLKRLIDDGSKWVVVTGYPGDGKTVVAYLVLKYLSDLGKDVLIIREPSDYMKARRRKNVVFLFEDILERTTFSISSFEKWSSVLNDLKNINERQTMTTNLVLMTQRLNVWKYASSHAAEYLQFIEVFNVSQIERPYDEKIKIWKYHAHEYKVEVNYKDVVTVCRETDALPYGFPSICRRFAQLAKKSSLAMVDFFSKPVEFINEAMDPLLVKDSIRRIFKEMLRGDKYVPLEILDEEQRTHVSHLDGTYLTVKRESEVVEFTNEAVYESAAFIIAKRDPQSPFVIENCKIDFLKERIIFTDVQESEVTHERHVQVYSSKTIVDSFLKRSLKEIINNRNIEPVLSHGFYTQKRYAVNLMERLVSEEDISTLKEKKDKVSGKSFLYLASSNGTGHILIYICQQRRINLSPTEQQEAIFGICQYNAADALQFFMEKYPDFDWNVTNREKQTPFMISGLYGAEECQRVLSGHLEKTKFGLQTDTNGKTVLHMLSEQGGSTDVLKNLILAGANVNAKCNNRMSPLHYAVKNGHAEVVAQLIRFGADVNMKSGLFSTPLSVASNEGYADIIEILVEHDAQINDQVCNIACINGHTNIVKKLLQRGADVDRAKLLNTALRRGDTYMIQTLVECQTDVNEMSEAYTQYDQWNEPNTQVDASGQCSIRRIKSPPLLAAYYYGKSEAVKLLIGSGANVNTKASDGCAIFSIAFEYHNEDSIVHLVNGGLDTNMAGRDGNAILHIACQSVLQVAVKTILEKGADVNILNSYGETSLHMACKAKYGFEKNEASYTEGDFKALLNIVKMLVEKGGNVNLKENQGNTPLHIACKHKLRHIARFLLLKGADLTLKNDAKETALKVLCFGNFQYEDILCLAEMMIEKGASKDELDGWVRSEYTRKQALLVLRQEQGN